MVTECDRESAVGRDAGVDVEEEGSAVKGEEERGEED